MGKASLRRRKSRQKYLKKLSIKDPVKFRAEWSKRLESWSLKAVKMVNELKDAKGNPAKTVFYLIDYALEELSGCGDDAMAMEGEKTKEVMTVACCKAVAKVVDGRIYRPVIQYPQSEH